MLALDAHPSAEQVAHGAGNAIGVFLRQEVTTALQHRQNRVRNASCRAFANRNRKEGIAITPHNRAGYADATQRSLHRRIETRQVPQAGLKEATGRPDAL